MSRIPSKDTKPEILVRKFLHRQGYRYKLHDKSLPGTPDIVLPKYNTVIFVHGCFWHSHGCDLAKPPKSNLEYWVPKLRRVVQRGNLHVEDLKQQGWNILIIWECDLTRAKIDRTLSRLLTALV